uniref:Uncharacterized protein n=1 Tax=Oryza brachyantha TaxID=4533 RepID=J3N259_ORYBR
MRWHAVSNPSCCRQYIFHMCIMYGALLGLIYHQCLLASAEFVFWQMALSRR